jgi:hypothetical protein
MVTRHERCERCHGDDSSATHFLAREFMPHYARVAKVRVDSPSRQGCLSHTYGKYGFFSVHLLASSHCP